MKKLAVVILNYNGEDFLKKFLPSFLEYSEFPVVVIDNASTDGSVDFLNKNFQNVQLVILEKNYGFAGGYNQGLKNLNFEYFLIVNSDIEVTPYWIDPLLDFLEKNPSFAACQPKIKSFNKKNEFEYAGAAGGFIDNLGYPYCRGRIFDHLEEDKGQYDDNIEVFWTSGACFLIRSKLFQDSSGFDEDFFAHMEEIDLCWRLKNEGWKFACIPESTVYHVGGGTLSATSPKKTYLNFRNGLSLLHKNLPPHQLKKIIFRIILDWVAALKFLISGQPRHSISVIKAHFDYFKMISSNNNKRALLKHRPIEGILFKSRNII